MQESLNQPPSIEFDAALTKDELLNGEQAAESWSVTRRCALRTLTSGSAQQLENMDAETADALMGALDSLSEYLKWRERDTELLKAAQARMLVILQAYSEEHPNHEAELAAQTGEAS